MTGRGDDKANYAVDNAMNALFTAIHEATKP